METADQKMEILIERVSSDQSFERVFEIRRQVFQIEQQVPEEIEIDGHDPIAHHYLAWLGQEACGTARWRRSLGGFIKLERFAVLKAHRGKGIGVALVRTMLADLPSGKHAYLNAQEPVIGFYEKLGFKKIGDRFFEADIPHFRMEYLIP